MTTTVLVTGVSTYLGAAVARGIAEREDTRVVGVDVRSPADPMGGAEFLRSDVRNPLLGRLLRQSEVDTVVHFGFAPHADSRTARVSAREAAVIGTMQLMGLCQPVPSLKHVVLASTGSVYGASAATSAVVSESAPVATHARAGHVRDAIEVETYVRSLTNRRPDVGVSILRMAPVVGLRTKSKLTDYLSSPVVPVPFGFDARLQLLAEPDAVTALTTAATGHPVGIVNVGAHGIITLRQALRIARRPSVPVPTSTGRALGTISRWVGSSTLDRSSVEYMMFGRCLDVSLMRSTLGFEPTMTTRETFEWYVEQAWGVTPHHAGETPGPVTPEEKP